MFKQHPVTPILSLALVLCLFFALFGSARAQGFRPLFRGSRASQRRGIHEDPPICARIVPANPWPIEALRANEYHAGKR